MAKKKKVDSGSNRIARRSVLSDEVYEMIKTMILAHEITPGSRVNIDSLAVQLKVSQTPVREALARLESDGLITKEPLKGYKATNLLTLKEFDDLFQFRLLIEPWAAEQAAKKIDNAGKAALKAEIQSAKTAFKFKDDEQIQTLVEHDVRFHSLIANISGNESIASAFERTHCHLHFFRLYIANKMDLVDHADRPGFIKDLFEQYYQKGAGKLAFKEHEVIAKAIIEMKPKIARNAMHSHIESSLKRFSPSAESINKE